MRRLLSQTIPSPADVKFSHQAGWGPAVTLLVNEPSGILSSAELATVPLFLLMGTFASVAGFSTDIYNVAAAFLGHRRGGLAYATIGGSAAFGVVCGSSTATAATFGKIAFNRLRLCAPSVVFLPCSAFTTVT